MFKKLLIVFSVVFVNCAFAQSQSMSIKSTEANNGSEETSRIRFLNNKQSTNAADLTTPTPSSDSDADKSDNKALLPKKPLSQFQKFIFETTGRLLPVFGESALQTSIDRDLLNQPVSADYEIGAGDEVLIRTWGGIDINVKVLVDRDGQFTIPSVGTFPVAGIKARNLEDFLTVQVGKYFKNFNLSATLGKLGGVNIYVAGHALVPGLHNVTSTSTLSSVALGLAQPGLSGSFRSVQLKRGGVTVASFDLYDLLRKGELTGDRKLLAGDVVFIGQAGKRIALNVDGSSAAIFELKEGETLDDLLSIAGVDKTLLRQDTVLIEGFDVTKPDSPRVVDKISYSRALNDAQLKDGDVVTIRQVRREFLNAVTLKGAVSDPSRHPYFSGMRVADIISSTDVLIAPDYFKKKGALVGYSKDQAERSYLDQRLLETIPLKEQIARNRQADQLTKSLSADIDKGSVEKDSVVKESTEFFEGNVKGLLPQLNWEYALIERLNRDELKPILLPFNLKKAMARDPQHNLELQAGDVITVFSSEESEIPKSKRTIVVKVMGEVSAPGYYPVNFGETLRDVLVKAGGVTDEAFLFGMKFTRSAIEKEQQAQYNKALDQAERLLTASVNNNVASAIDPAGVASSQTQAANVRRYLEKLRASKPDGRVILDIKPEAENIAELPSLTLEHGDSIFIPSTPGQVAIFGSVYTQAAFAYQRGQTVFDYLSMAGGASKTSDKNSIFVLRANGTVDSAQQGWIPFASGLNGKKALPGDAIYVPEDFDRVSLTKRLLDIAQIFYQVGLGAIAIEAIRD
jgi:polysaccharide biosynthesis/export protein